MKFLFTLFFCPGLVHAGTITPYFLSCEAVIGTRRSGEAGAVAVSFTKNFSAKAYAEVLAKVEALLKTDANPVEQNDHKHFGSPFAAAAGDATHLYCVSEGVAPEKNWVCYLYVAERLP